MLNPIRSLRRMRIVCDEQDCFLQRSAEFFQQLHDLVRALAVEIARWFIRDDQKRIGDDRPRDAHALLLPAGELSRSMAVTIAESDEIERGQHLLFAFRGRQRQKEQRQLDVLVRGQHGQQVIELKDKADVPRPPLGEFPFRHLGDAVRPDPNFPFARPIKPGNQVQQRRFAAAAGAHQADEFARHDFQIQAAEDIHPFAAALEKLMHARHTDDRFPLVFRRILRRCVHAKLPWLIKLQYSTLSSFPPAAMNISRLLCAVVVSFLAASVVFAQEKKADELVPNNLAFNKKASASSEEKGTQNFAANAFDGDASTRWCANGSQAGEWLQVDLGKVETLTGVRIDWEAAGGKYKYKVEGSADAKDWKLLVDKADNDQPSPNENKFAAKDIRYVRVTFLGNPSGGWGSISELAVLGTELVKPMLAAVSDGKPNQKLLSEVKVPGDFTATIFASPPQVNYPVFVGASVEGDLYVAVDKNGSLGRGQHMGSVLLLRDTDNDGQADEIKKFIPDVDSPRGLVWDHDRLYLMHPPHLSVFIDKDRDGVSDEQKILVKNCAFDLKARPADHTSNGVTLGIDGWLYLAIGDFGFMEAEGVDGRKLQLRGGGVVRVRTDGTGLELYCRGTRNILEVSVDPLLNGFSRDNTNDGGGWDIRLHHYTGMEDHGYPRRYMHFNEEVIQPLADYGGGSGCGGLFLSEPGFPRGLGQSLYTCDWGRSEILRHPLTAKGATFSADQEVFAKLPRVTDMDVDGSSRLYMASWKDGQFDYKGENIGFIARAVPKGYEPPKCPDFEKLSIDELVGLLTDKSHRRRMEAQRMLVRKGLDGTATLGTLGIAVDESAPLEVRVAAIYAVSLTRGEEAVKPLLEVAKIPAVREYALRAIADGAFGREYAAKVPTEAFVAALACEFPRVRLQAAVCLARLEKKSAAKDIVPLLSDADPVVAHTAVQVLVQLNAVDPCLAAVDRTDVSPQLRAGALRVLGELHQQAVVEQIIVRLQKETDSLRRAGLFACLCRLHFEEGKWTGDSWGTRPDTTGPYYVRAEWEGSPQVLAALKAALDKAEGSEAASALAELNRHKIPLSGGREKLLAAAAQDDRLLPNIATEFAKAEEVPAAAIPLLAKVAIAKSSPPPLRADAIQALVTANSADALPAVFQGLDLFEGNRKKNDKEEMRARVLLLASTSLELHLDDIAKLAAQTNKSDAVWADAVLLKLLTTGSAEGQARAAAALDAGWQDPARRAQIISAVALARQMTYRAKVVEALNDSDKKVAAAAKAIAAELRFETAAFKSEGPTISTLPPDDAVAKALAMKGDLAHGEELFNRLQCTKCHTTLPGEALKGPFLGTIANTYKRQQLAEAIVLPSKQLAQGFVTTQFLMDDGRVLTGFVTKEAADSVTIRDADAKEYVLPVEAIETRKKQTVSVMPEGLVKDLTVSDLASLVDFLEALPKMQPK